MNKANNSTRTYVGTYVCTRMVFHTNHMFPIRYEVRVLLVKMFWLYHSLYFGKKNIYIHHIETCFKQMSGYVKLRVLVKYEKQCNA